jgi:5-methylcytosine-specific restriction endonuclease McrA
MPPLLLDAAVPYKDPERRRAYGRESIRRNAEKAREAMRRWRQRHPAAHAAASRSYYSRHKRELAAYFATYRREHRDVRQAIDARRRGRELQATGSFSTFEWIELLQRWNWRCSYCGETGPLEAEHRVPLARGGSNSIENIVPACRACNQRKHLLTDAEFRARLAAERASLPPLGQSHHVVEEATDQQDRQQAEDDRAHDR